ncbi:MAG: (4Fe-4S)-binding protein [Deltaproteobacteria bacterium]|nr:MAG: (4Fe-4S)-binding protein [Deltaproteobacteria bacterium]
MIISVASGKGGTGKTTVATNMATALGTSVQLLDCDVEEPNAHLFLNPEIVSTQEVHTMIPEIDTEKCIACGQCAAICRFSAITMVARTVLTFPELCHGCGGCVEVCPTGAVAEGQRELGVVELGRARDVAFGHGKMRIGEAMAPPLIGKVRDHAQTDGLVIIDAPPGTSCPVIAAMQDTDFIVLVTEPTPFGLHDLKLAVGAIKLLKIPCGLVINRSDLGTDEVRRYALAEGIPILLEIPFDRAIAEAYSQGRMLVDVVPEWRKEFIGMYQNIKTLAEC